MKMKMKMMKMKLMKMIKMMKMKKKTKTMMKMKMSMMMMKKICVDAFGGVSASQVHQKLIRGGDKGYHSLHRMLDLPLHPG